MDDFPLLMLALALFLMGGILFLMIPTSGNIHPLGLNVTHLNDTTCRYTWLGGTDYDSFVRDISVDGVSVGHPGTGSVIHTGNCSSVVKMYFKDVKAYRELWPHAEDTGRSVP